MTRRLKLEDRINRISPNPAHPHWLLVSQCSKPVVTPAGPVGAQLLVYDQVATPPSPTPRPPLPGTLQGSLQRGLQGFRV